MDNKINVKLIALELNPTGGFVEWVSSYGVGVNFSSPSSVDDELLSNIPETLKNVVWLNLSGANISDSGLKHLATAKKLEEIDLSDTQFTLKEIVNLITELPNLAELKVVNVFRNENDKNSLQDRFPEITMKFV